MPAVTLHDVTLHFTDTGSGPMLLLVHGHPFNRSMWAPQQAFFSQRGWRVVAADLRGYGQSTGTPGALPFAVFAQDLQALLGHLRCGPAVVAGLSMGGQIVMELYHTDPALFRGMILADTFAGGETPAGKIARRTTADRLLREGLRPYAEEVLPKMISPRTIASQPAVAHHVMEMMLTTPPEGAAAALRARAERRDYGEMLARIAVPTQVVVGREDVFTPVADAEFLRDHIPGARLAVIADAGHMPNLEQPAAFNAVVAEFLEALPPGSA